MNFWLYSVFDPKVGEEIILILVFSVSVLVVTEPKWRSVDCPQIRATSQNELFKTISDSFEESVEKFYFYYIYNRLSNQNHMWNRPALASS